MSRILLSSVAAVALLASAASASAQTEIQWWHAMGGKLGEAVATMADTFNKSQTEYKVVPVFKGDYTETFTAVVAAVRAKQGPAIAQIFEVGTATMMAAKGAVYPVYKLMEDEKEPFDPKAFIGPVYGYYSTTDGKLLSMPFNSSTPVMYWNKEMFKKAGLDPDVPPKTWADVGAAARKLVDSGAKCGFTTAWQTWVLLENYGALHDLPFATLQNGFGGLGTELKFNDEPRVKLISMLAEWTKDKRFTYGGRMDKPTPMMTGGECGIEITSSGAASTMFASLKPENVGIGMMPYSPEVKAQPQNSIIGGATLWVLQGRPKAEYKGVAKFLNFVASPEIAAKWHQETGYVPITVAAAKLTEESGFYKKNPGRDVAVKQLMLNPPTENSKGLRLGNFVQIRDAEDEELEGVWSGQKDARTALDAAVKRGNELLRKFEAANK
jgi:sn-glycerol 3-phosphate transport system substrate-binding protein